MSHGPQDGNRTGALFIQVELAGLPCGMLVDTGATVSLLRPDLVEKLDLVAGMPNIDVLQTAGNGLAKVMGQCCVLVRMGDLTFNHTFYVVDIKDKGIVGLDFLEHIGARLDLPQEKLYMQTQNIPILKKWQCVERGLQVVGATLEGTWISKALDNSALKEGTEDYHAARLLLWKYREIFAEGERPLGKCTIVKHSIDTGDERPIKQNPRKIPYSQNNHVDQLLKEMTDQGVIEPSHSPWASPIVLVPKKDGSTRFCVDYRRLNMVTKKDSYTLPCIQSFFDALGGSNWFCVLDLKSGYWQVALNEADKEKTAFTLYGKGLWQFKVLPFGLCNAPATFQRLMDRLIPAELALVYLDDIIVHGPDIQDVLFKLEKVLHHLKGAGLQVQPKKCSFFQKKVHYLGHIISGEGVQTDPAKTQSVQEWPTPCNKRQIRSFMGMCSYYRRFIQNFAEIAQPLYQIQDKVTPFVWNENCQDSFAKLKQVMTSTPILAFPDFQKPFMLDCDASSHSVGAVLSQVNEGMERVVAYFSKTLSKQQRNYCATRRELLAVVLGVEHFHQYLYGVDFTLRTDHASLSWLTSFRRPEGIMARWLEKLQAYSFKVVHRAGKHHGNADGLSRRPCADQCSYCERKDEKEAHQLNALWMTTEDEWQDKDMEWLKKRLLEGNKPDVQELVPLDPKLRQLVGRWDSLKVMNGRVYHKWEGPGKRFHWQAVVPITAVPTVLQQCHSSPAGGHFGFQKTLGKVRQCYYWIGMASDVKAWCKNCHECRRVKGPGPLHTAPLQQFMVGGPFERIGMDILGPFPRTKRGNRYVLVVADYFTKWPEVVAIPNQEAQTVAAALVEQVICRHGVPYEVHTDQGRNFESRLLQEVINLLGMRRTRSTPLHPQSGGLVERLNRTLTKFLAVFVNKKQDDWDDKLPLFMLAYRSAPHNTTGFSPAQLVFGRNLHLPEELFRTAPKEPQQTTHYAFKLRQDLKEVRDLACETMEIQMRRQKERFDRKAKQPPFDEGDWVWVHDPKRTVGRCPKLQPQWTGPWIITKKKNDILFQVQMGKTKRLLHANRLANADVKPVKPEVKEERGGGKRGGGRG